VTGRLARFVVLLGVTVVPVLEGEVEALRGSTVTLRGPQGQRVDVDVGAIHVGADRLLLPGRRVSLLGVVAGDDGRLSAQGIALEYGAPALLGPRENAPAASPPIIRPSPSPVPAPAAPAPAPSPQLPPQTIIPPQGVPQQGAPPPGPAPTESPGGVVGPPAEEPTLGPGPAPTPR
jgi:hypothetical protein